MSTVDVIIPAHNPGPFLRDALNSVIQQTFKDFHIYVIDDASIEDFKELVEGYKKATYIRLENNGGPAKARNIGIAAGSSEFISLLDADDVWHSRKLERSLNEFKKNPHIAMTCGNYQRFVNRSEIYNPFYRRKIKINHNTLQQINFVASGSVTIKRDIFDEFGGFDESLYLMEDYDLWLRIATKYPISYIHKVLYFYSVIPNGNSLTNRDDMQKAHHGLLEKIKARSMKMLENDEDRNYKNVPL